ncbi:LytR family transcriptional regulator [Staphylococcus warneri]|uniref:LCP family protein n=1 Tax=Staphylococcus warneri TaxID=1292 RepID=UPI000D1FB16D|nr:LCP family protein [Staphylococcus warneri]PTI19607.1 LytR family transcriptional regulator [Staphylococcus warneri]
MYNSKNKKSKKKIVFLISSIIILVFILIILYLGIKLLVTGNKIYKPLDKSEDEIADNRKNIKHKKPLTIALFGVDSNEERKRSDIGQRSDSIIILSINPNKNKTVMLSIPRDTQAEIVGKGSEEKIAHAYAYGGPNMSVKSLEKFLDISIDHYATIDMDGLKNIIDDLGGINVESNATFQFDGKKFNKGQKTHVNGDEAMKFIRSRKQEGAGGDFGRQERQQLVLKAISNKMSKVSSIPHINSIMSSIQKNVRTDLKISEMNSIRKGYKNANKNVNKLQLDGRGAIQQDGLYYFIPKKESKQDAVNKMKNNLK